MSLLSRIKQWWADQPTHASELLEGKVIIPQRRFDGFPKNADECRRSYRFGDGVNSHGFLNVKCRACGDQILRHDYESEASA